MTWIALLRLHVLVRSIFIFLYFFVLVCVCVCVCVCVYDFNKKLIITCILWNVVSAP